MRPSLGIALVAALAAAGRPTAESRSTGGTATEPERALANENRTPAGTLIGGVLTVRLELRQARWYPEAEDGRSEVVQVLAEAGKPATIPGPLIRVHATVRNTLAGDTLVLRGLHARPNPGREAVRVAPGASAEVDFVAGTPGTYYYWGSTTGEPLDARDGIDSQLSGALIVDPPGRRAADRVFVIGVWHAATDSLGPKPWVPRDMMVINGKSWPYTEPFTFAQGEGVRWRWVNASSDSHPMHLHGFYFDVESRGGWAADTVYARGDRRRVVTELMLPGATMTMAWRAERAGNWLFHCHFAFHVSSFLSFDRVPDPVDPGAPDAADHSVHGMRGLVLGIRVLPRPGSPAAGVGPAAQVRSIRLVAATLPDDSASPEHYGFTTEAGVGGHPPRGAPEPALVLRRGEPVRITVVNGLRAPIAVHWHGIEVQQSYVDGVPGWSGDAGRLAPAVATRDSFVAEFTPTRAGTFIFHSHSNEQHQISSGLYDALVVLERGRSAAAPTDLTFVLGGDNDHGRINHQPRPGPVEMAVGVAYRLRLVNISTDRRMIFTLRGNGASLRWRALAKDGADLPPRQATTRPATLLTGPGETADFEFTPTLPGELRLEATTQTPPAWSVHVPIHVRTAPGGSSSTPRKHSGRR
jgi:FtsP/CotA-like multicopper oxidase with cupredoxin domain